jgi:hypothetical protein
VEVLNTGALAKRIWRAAVSVYLSRRVQTPKEGKYVRILSTILAGVAILMSLATPLASAGPATDCESFLKKIGEFALPFIGNSNNPEPRGLCVCQDGSSIHGFAGVLLHEEVAIESPFLRVGCWVRQFDSDGAEGGVSSCRTFEVLSK